MKNRANPGSLADAHKAGGDCRAARDIARPSNHRALARGRAGVVGAFLAAAGAVGGVQSAHAGGDVRAWGYNYYGQCYVPTDLGACIAVSAGYGFTIAIRQDGGVRAWGENWSGQCDIPADLGPCSAIAAGPFHTVAIRQNGGVRAWGYNEYGQCYVPKDLGECTVVAAGFGHTVAIRQDGRVRAWGNNSIGQCNIPADLGACTSIAAGGFHTVALRRDGGVRAWGDNLDGQCYAPTNLGACTAIWAGGRHTVAITNPDCDHNGIADVNEIIGHDCNGDFILDTCNAAYDFLEDCNGNGLGDTCEKELTVSLASGHLGPIGFTSNQTWTIPAAVRAQSPVTLVIHGHGDFSGLQEFVRVKVGYGFDQHALQNTVDCENGTGTPSISTFTLTPEQFNAAIGADGALRVVMEPSIAVDANGCNGGTWIEASLEYIGALPADCNANGLLDSCEIAAGYGPDVNHNGVVDTCESLILPCPTDFNQNGRTDGADLGMLLSAWGASNQPGLDLDHNGRIDGADLGMLLSGWGPCVQ